MNAKQYNQLFDEVIEKYHIIDDVDQPFENPFDKNTVLNFLKRLLSNS